MTYYIRAVATEQRESTSSHSVVVSAKDASGYPIIPPVPQPKTTSFSLDKFIDRLPFPSEILPVLPMVAFIFISYFLGFVGAGWLFFAVVSGVATQQTSQYYREEKKIADQQKNEQAPVAILPAPMPLSAASRSSGPPLPPRPSSQSTSSSAAAPQAIVSPRAAAHAVLPLDWVLTTDLSTLPSVFRSLDKDRDNSVSVRDMIAHQQALDVARGLSFDSTAKIQATRIYLTTIGHARDIDAKMTQPELSILIEAMKRYHQSHPPSQSPRDTIASSRTASKRTLQTSQNPFALPNFSFLKALPPAESMPTLPDIPPSFPPKAQRRAQSKDDEKSLEGEGEMDGEDAYGGESDTDSEMSSDDEEEYGENGSDRIVTPPTVTRVPAGHVMKPQLEGATEYFALPLLLSKGMLVKADDVRTNKANPYAKAQSASLRPFFMCCSSRHLIWARFEADARALQQMLDPYYSKWGETADSDLWQLSGGAEGGAGGSTNPLSNEIPKNTKGLVPAVSTILSRKKQQRLFGTSTSRASLGAIHFVKLCDITYVNENTLDKTFFTVSAMAASQVEGGHASVSAFHFQGMTASEVAVYTNLLTLYTKRIRGAALTAEQLAELELAAGVQTNNKKEERGGCARACERSCGGENGSCVIS